MPKEATAKKVCWYCCPAMVYTYSLMFFSLAVDMQTRKAAAEKPALKGKKDPNTPKRALSAYMFFSQDWRERIKVENPDAGFGECVLVTCLDARLKHTHEC